jgi:hypothetical protein
VARFCIKNPPEVFVSTAAMSAPVSRAVAAGRLRKLGSRLYTTNLTENRESLVRRHLWDITAGLFPGGLIADRTALEQRPAPDGSVFMVASKGGKVTLPGVTLRAARPQDSRRFPPRLMPKTLTADWQTMLGPAAEDVHERWLDLFGNLILTGYNSELSNSSFARKRQLLADSHFDLNKWIANKEKWTEAELRERSELLFTQTSKIWERPAE